MTDHRFVSSRLDIEPSYLDYNGHVNVAYHVLLADLALDQAFEPAKGANYIETRGMTTFAGEIHVRYLREINGDDDIRGRVTWIGGDAKRVMWAVELIRASDGEVATTVEGVSLSVSVATRRVAAFPEDVQAWIAAAIERDAAATRALAWLGRRVAMKR